MNIYIFGYIYNSEAESLVEQLKAAAGEAVNVVINSEGGEVFSSMAMSHAIRNYQGEIRITVTGLCASAATLLLCSGKPVTASKGSLFMIHSPSVMLHENYTKEDLAQIQTTLEKLEASVTKMYESRLKKPIDFAAGDLWLDTDEALEYGLIDAVEGEEVEIEVDAAQRMIFVNKLAMGAKFVNVLEKKYQASVRAAELGRINKLVEMRGDNAAVNAIIDVAMKRGQSVEDVKEYISALSNLKIASGAGTSEICAVIKEQMASGAANVQGQAEPTAAEIKMAQRNKVASFANQELGARN